MRVKTSLHTAPASDMGDFFRVAKGITRGTPKTQRGPAHAGPLQDNSPVEASVALVLAPYIIPDMSGMPPPPPPPPSFSGTSATIASVVRMFLAIDAAF